MRPEQIIVTHAGTDFDAFGAMAAARRLYPQATICLQGGLNRNVREFARVHADDIPAVEASRCDLSAVCRVIVVETAHLARLGDVAEVVRRPGVETVLFDHHGEGAPDWVAEERYVASADGALSSTMVGILAERGIEPTPTEATALALGIHEDTGSLTYPGTTLRDAEALAFCMRHGASQELIGLFLHSPLSEDQRALLTTLLDAAEPVTVGGAEALVAAVAWPRYVDGVSTLATKIVDLTDCQALLLLVGMDGRVFVVGRSRSPVLDVGAALEALGGGGHAQAASAMVRDRPLGEVRAAALEALRGGIAPGPRAADVMSVPAYAVDAGATIDEAMAECRRRRISGVLLAEGGALAGAVEREDLDRAIGHGLAHAPVRAVMGPLAEPVAFDATIVELGRALGRGASPRLPVLRPGAAAADPLPLADVAGVVTRSDLLHALHERVTDGAEPSGAERVDLREQLHGLPGLEPLWAAVQEVAVAFDGVYLVGGAVRDLLLGERSFDIDLAVEGDGVDFAERLAAVLHGRSHAHPKFHTAVVLAGGLRVDVATARTEHYEYPAALPIVEHSSIRQDLFRRDFTVNAMAIALHAAEHGQLVDPYGGRADLDAGRLRVLHTLSFIEDPTRIFRAVRYENRYGFRMDAHTLRLARGCVDMGLVADVSGARVRDELVAILSEERVGGSIARMCELRLGEALHPGLDCGPATAELVERMDALRGRLAPELPAWRLRLSALARGLPAADLDAWLERLRVRRRDARVVAAAAVLPARLRGPLAAAASRGGIAELLAPHPIEVALAVAAGPDGAARDAACVWLERVRHVRLEVDGADLQRELGLAESPELGRLLDALLREKRDGGLAGRDEELAAARRLLGAAAEAAT